MRRRSLLPVAVGVGVAVNTLRLRQRLAALAVAEPADGPVDPAHVFLVADGIRLDEPQRRAASAYAVREGLDVVDLVPGQLPAQRLLDLARTVDTRTYRGSRLAPGRGAFVALLVDRELLTRSGLEPKEVDEAGLVDALGMLKKFAPARTGLVVVPGLSAPPRAGADRVAVQLAAHAWDPARPLFPVVRDTALVLGAAANPPAAVAAALLSALQPRLVTDPRLRLHPDGLLASAVDRRLGAAQWAVDHLRRWTRRRSAVGAPGTSGTGTSDPGTSDAVALPGTSAGSEGSLTPGARPARGSGALAALGLGGSDPAAAAAKAAEYRDDLRYGLERFFEPRRDTCPWCASSNVCQLFVGTDLAQCKPGRFDYDRCESCGHTFQNPRLSLAGLEFYYRDFYDGLGAAMMEVLFGFNPEPYLARARAVPGQPSRWLDVGGGLGHFCNVARDVWPATTFDGLDLGAGIDEAQRRGWVDHAYRGMFPDLADGLAGSYDVVSMFHYLEHTRDPRAEIDAAATVLSPGRHLLVEVPNPQSPAARAYGPFWPGWLVPQHQHLIPADNLVEAMEQRGFAVESVEFGEVHQPGDPVIALWSLLQRVAPSPSAPWRDDPNPALARGRRALAAVAVVPAFVPAIVLDVVSRAYLCGERRSNAYRVLARRI